MRLAKLGGIVFIAVLAAQVGVLGQAARSPEAALKAAQYQANVRGDWTGAIAEFIRLSEATNRAVAAHSLVALGDAYQKTGLGDPREVFARVIKDFGDQAEASSLANRRLAAFRASGVQELVSRRVWASHSFSVADVGASGMRVVGFEDRGFDAESKREQDLAIRDTGGGQTTALVSSTSAGAPVLAILSPDEQQVAYVWRARDGSRLSWAGLPSLHLIAAKSGATPRTLVESNASVDVLVPVGWSADGSEVFCLSQPPDNTEPTSLIAVATSGGAVRTVRTFATWPIGFRLSDDRQWAAYTVGAAQDFSDVHVRVMGIQTGQDSKVVGWTGQSRNLVWTPDGSHLLFQSDRLGTLSLFAVRIEGGRAAGEPFLVQQNFAATGMRVTSSGSLFYTDRSRQAEVVLIGDRQPGSVTAIQSFLGGVPAISPDGASVAFYMSSGSIAVRSLTTGVERVFKQDGLGFGTGGGYLSTRWLPDNSGVMVWVTPEGDGGQPGGGFYHLDLDSGKFTRRFARFIGDLRLTRAGALTADGQMYYFVANKSREQGWTTVVGVDMATGTVKSTVPIANGGLPYSSAFSLALSPDEQTLAVSYALPYDRTMHLAAVTLATGSWRELGAVQGSTMPDRIAWTPDGLSVLSGAYENGSWRLMRIPATGGAPEYDGFDLANVSGSVSIPAVSQFGASYGSLSADGSRIAISAVEKQRLDLWALDNVAAFLAAKR